MLTLIRLSYSFSLFVVFRLTFANISKPKIQSSNYACAIDVDEEI
jgi:hypothetical protein